MRLTGCSEREGTDLPGVLWDPRVHVHRAPGFRYAARVGIDFSQAFDVKLVESTTASWEFWYGLLELFVQREGHALPPQDHNEGDFPLGSWVNRQRTAHAASKLSPERMRRLEALRDWRWDVLSGQWETGFAALRNYVKREGHARPPLRYREGEFRLGQWVGVQRAAYSAGKLSPERARRLGAQPHWSWDQLADKWRPDLRRCDVT